MDTYRRDTRIYGARCNQWLPLKVSSRANLFLGTLLVLFCSLARAQNSVEVTKLQPLQQGVTLPVRLSKSLRAGKVKVGAALAVTTTQRVPVTEHLYLNRGATLHGQVVASTAGDGTTANPSVLSIRFSSLTYKNQSVPIAVKAIAIANLMDVADTYLPANGSTDRGNSNEASWTTRQVGDNVVVRTGWIGPVCDQAMRTVGSADYYGVYTLPVKSATGEGTSFPRAVGVFSTTAAGLYGLDDGTRLVTEGDGITLTRPAKKLLLRDGDNMLLEVRAPE